MADTARAADRSSTGKPSRAITDRIARWITEIFAPPVLTAVMPLGVAIHAAPRTLDGVMWGLATAIFTAAIPYALIWFGVRRGRLTDHHIGKREQRWRPLRYALTSVGVGLVAIAVAGAPRQLLAVVVVILLVLLVVAVVNRTWKLSAHAAFAASSATISAILFGPAATMLAALVAVICWARVRLKDHTVAQVCAGAVVGAAVPAPILALLGS